ALFNASRRFGGQRFSVHADFDSNEVGQPGPWGSDPKHTFRGINLISRGKNNFSDYTAHYEADLSDKVREDVFGSFFLDNSGYRSQFGFSYNKDLRGQGEARTIFSVNRFYSAALGVAGGREDVRNTFITDSDFTSFPIQRTNVAGYLENRFQFNGRLF